jgi:hypothetical protein
VDQFWVVRPERSDGRGGGNHALRSAQGRATQPSKGNDNARRTCFGSLLACDVGESSNCGVWPHLDPFQPQLDGGGNSDVYHQRLVVLLCFHFESKDCEKEVGLGWMIENASEDHGGRPANVNCE